MNPTQERWLPVVGYENIYEVSDHGRVRSVQRVVVRSNGHNNTVRERVLRPSISSNGYLKVNLHRPGVTKTVRVHRLVLEAFVGPCPEGMEGCHTNDDPEDNRLSNLRWDTSSANTQDMLRRGGHGNQKKTHCPLGHSLDAPNVKASKAKKGRRACLACDKARAYTRWNPHMKPHLQQISDDYYAKIVRTHTQAAA